MDIREMIREIEDKIAGEQKDMEAQEIIVNRLANDYREQLAILKAMKCKIAGMHKGLSELQEIHKEDAGDPPTDEIDADEYDERYKKLTDLLCAAIDVAIGRGLIMETVTTKTGNTLSMRKSIINRARNAIMRNCAGYSYIDFVDSLSENEMLKMRNIGEKSREVIRIAKELIREQKDK